MQGLMVGLLLAQAQAQALALPPRAPGLGECAVFSPAVLEGEAPALVRDALRVEGVAVTDSLDLRLPHPEFVLGVADSWIAGSPSAQAFDG